MKGLRFPLAGKTEILRFAQDDRRGEGATQDDETVRLKMTRRAMAHTPVAYTARAMRTESAGCRA
jgi:hypothetical protein